MRTILRNTCALLRKIHPTAQTLDEFPAHAREEAGRFILAELIKEGRHYKAACLMSRAATSLRVSADADDAVKALVDRSPAFFDYLHTDVAYALEGDLCDVLRDLDYENRPTSEAMAQIRQVIILAQLDALRRGRES